ncbi:ATP-binding protein [Streptomyces sp. TLI_146]|uniref:ATP-binding protein n=1 Tax=Streptomyces sp. TLI_146 TaxID=1938858 RepID=UPI000CA74700|nr:ATP-binding protein [Streptomyces sp. TLI_146]PKV82749.1 histidine kinase-like protein [Streptomyces sp. TLI_146]
MAHTPHHSNPTAPPTPPHTAPQVGSDLPPCLSRTSETGSHGLELGLSPAVFAAHQFDAIPISVPHSRTFLMRCLTRWRLATLNHTFTDNALLIVSELTTNAVLHTQPPPPPTDHRQFWLALHMQPTAVICAVTDPSPTPPHTPAPDLWAETGRGLHLVTTLATTWGWTPTPPPGKTIWARLALTG